MKILIGNDNYGAHYFERMGVGRAFTATGHEVIMWQMNQKSVNDAFDEFNPDLFICQTYSLKLSIVRAILERPHLRVICKAADWGPIQNTMDLNRFQILVATQQEIDTVCKLKEETGQPEYLYVQYPSEYIKETHGYWINQGIDVYDQLLAADVFEYTNGRYLPEFDSDITFVGGYWPYKAQVLDKYLLPLCPNYRVKIFGDIGWPVPQHCGHITDTYVKDVLASATICPNLSEPHAQQFGYEINERCFKLASNKCFIISDYVEGLTKLYPDEIVYARSPEEFHYRIDHFIKHPDERKPYIDRAFTKTIQEHTYFERVKDILDRLGYPTEEIDSAKQDVLKKLGIK